MSGHRLVWVLTPLLAVGLALNIARGIRLWEASRAVNVVRLITAQGTSTRSLTKPLILRNIGLLREAEALSPVDVDLPIARGGQNLLLGRPRAALTAFERALTLEPRGEVYAYIGQAQLAAGLYDEAEESFRTAVILDSALRTRVDSFLKQRRPRQAGAGS